MSAFDKHLTMLHQWARKDRRVALAQAARDESQHPGILDRLKYRLFIEREFARGDGPGRGLRPSQTDYAMVYRETATW